MCSFNLFTVDALINAFLYREYVSNGPVVPPMASACLIRTRSADEGKYFAVSTNADVESDGIRAQYNSNFIQVLLKQTEKTYN